MEIGKGAVDAEYIVVKALGPGVSVSGLTRGGETKFLHSEKLDPGEVFIAQFTQQVSVMKIRGHAKIFTEHGELESGYSSAEGEYFMTGSEEEEEEDLTF